mmetsp:Transcript_17526/g.57852  ORF Transcript_17526/g.57852 Transcript_17526/m.57852 type:complete len:354 (+) Transcript_17526:99-1160(+)
MNDTAGNATMSSYDNTTVMTLLSNTSWDFVTTTTSVGSDSQAAASISTTVVEMLMTTNSSAEASSSGKSGATMLQIIAFAISGGVAGLLLLMWCYFFGFRKYGWKGGSGEQHNEEGADENDAEERGVARDAAREEVAEDELNICSSPAQAIEMGETPRGGLWKNSSTPTDLREAIRLRKEDDAGSRASGASAAHSLLPELMEANSSTRMPTSELSARKKHAEEERMGKKSREKGREGKEEEEEEEGREGKEEQGDKRPKMSPFAKLWHKGTNEEEEMEKGNLKQEEQPNEPGGITSRLRVDAAQAQQRMSESFGGLMDWIGTNVTLPCSGGRMKMPGMDMKTKAEWEEDEKKP